MQLESMQTTVKPIDFLSIWVCYKDKVIRKNLWAVLSQMEYSNYIDLWTMVRMLNFDVSWSEDEYQNILDLAGVKG